MHRWFLPVVAGLFVVACASGPAGPSGLEVYQAYDRPALRAADPDAVRVKVSTSRQRVYVMEGRRPLLVMPVSVGSEESPTPHGEFRILRKKPRHRARDHGFSHRVGEARRDFRHETPEGWSFTGTPLPYWCQFSGDHAFHTGWVRHRPCTDGSIRMHENLAPKFFQLVRVGTPVDIAFSQPEDATLGSIPLPPDAGPLPDYPPEFHVGDGYFTRHLPPRFSAE